MSQIASASASVLGLIIIACFPNAGSIRPSDLCPATIPFASRLAFDNGEAQRKRNDAFFNVGHAQIPCTNGHSPQSRTPPIPQPDGVPAYGRVGAASQHEDSPDDTRPIGRMSPRGQILGTQRAGAIPSEGAVGFGGSPANKA